MAAVAAAQHRLLEALEELDASCRTHLAGADASTRGAYLRARGRWTDALDELPQLYSIMVAASATAGSSPGPTG